MLRAIACGLLSVSLCLARVGSKTCGLCHQQIYQSYIRTDMGRSMTLASDEAHLALAPVRVSVAASTPDRFVDVFRQNGHLFQTEYQKEPDGSELFRVTRQLEYVIGSGMNGSTYLVADNGFLYQAPLSYFTKAQQWEWSPGYEKEDAGFNRPILAGCITCHSGRANTTSSANGRFDRPPFEELSIGCENCHGPGQTHVLKRTRDSIINPARLPPRLAENICIRCHQSGDATVLQPGKDYSDFRPGEWLAKTLVILRRPGTTGNSEILDHYSAMTLSKCFMASKGSLTCTSCHDPHSRPVDKAAWYRARCLSCHQKITAHPAPPADCIGCHMPQRGLRQFAHSALTDHRIIAREGEPYPNTANQTTPEQPDLIYVNRPEDPSLAAIPDVMLLEAYRIVAPRFPDYGPRYLALLQKLQTSKSEDPALLSALGRHEMSLNTPDHDAQACDYFTRAVHHGASDPAIYQAWAEVLARSNRLPEAVDILKEGIDKAPWDETLYKYLAWRLIRLGRYQEAKQTIAGCVERFPQDDFMRHMLAQVAGARE
jgi:hypothetical protein